MLPRNSELNVLILFNLNYKMQTNTINLGIHFEYKDFSPENSQILFAVVYNFASLSLFEAVFEHLFSFGNKVFSYEFYHNLL